MNAITLHIGLDVHNDSITGAASGAPDRSTIRGGGVTANLGPERSPDLDRAAGHRPQRQARRLTPPAKRTQKVTVSQTAFRLAEASRCQFKEMAKIASGAILAGYLRVVPCPFQGDRMR